MSSLRRPVRLTSLSGSQLNAVVEAVIQGRATVRINGNGKRYTHLPIVGTGVEAGDPVIVDLGAEGQPVVRPLTSPYRGEDFQEAPPVEIEIDNDPSLVVGRVEATVPQIMTIGYLTAYPIARSYQCRFDEVKFNEGGAWGVNSYRMYPPVSGRYHLSATVAFEGPPDDNCKIDIAILQAGYRMGAEMERHWDFRSKQVFHVDTVHTLYTGEFCYFYLRPVPGWGWSSGDPGPQIEISTVVSAGNYPCFSWNLIERINPNGPIQRDKEWWYATYE